MSRKWTGLDLSGRDLLALDINSHGYSGWETWNGGGANSEYLHVRRFSKKIAIMRKFDMGEKYQQRELGGRGGDKEWGGEREIERERRRG